MAYQDELTKLQDFHKSGGRMYEAAYGCPDRSTPMIPMIEELKYKLVYLTEQNYRIFELGPHGGRWTDQIYRLFQQIGFPAKLEYYLFGQEVEHKLVLRDVIQRLQPLSEYNKLYRIRIKAEHRRATTRLLSDVIFYPMHFDFLTPTPPPIREECDLLVCMGNLQHLTDMEIATTTHYFDYLLRDGGWLLTDIQTSRLSLLTGATGLTQFGFQRPAKTVSINGFTTLLTRKPINAAQ